MQIEAPRTTQQLITGATIARGLSYVPPSAAAGDFTMGDLITASDHGLGVTT